MKQSIVPFIQTLAERIIQDSDIDNLFESIYCMIVTKTQKYHAEGMCWAINSVIEQNINISKYKP